MSHDTYYYQIVSLEYKYEKNNVIIFLLSSKSDLMISV